MKDVADSCLQQLYGEIVRSMIERHAREMNGSKEGARTETFSCPEDVAAQREAVTMKLEAMGYDVGFRFAEIVSIDKPRMQEPLDVIKFVCKDFWVAMFKKQIDKLQTNHRGVFVVQDFSFRWLTSLSAATELETRDMALLFLVFPCGVIRGALANLGLTGIVNADIPDVHALPGCRYQPRQ
ncbi:hypothetical protein PsorP6_016406 [Peronosclerospora sorghi]|uniref:Uncharacterized protein n=1 Tax=Peronosclerospora sorghi TaxID=230839 RepID=A0ACC0VT33_9STRA|nr:hypothetical protein PsorP6_016406 [Peronosclerospora sorghi]